MGAPPSGQPENWVEFYPKPIFKVFEMLIRVTSFQVYKLTVSPGVCTQLRGSRSQATSSSLSPLALSNFLRISSSVLQGTLYFYNYACLGAKHCGDRLKNQWFASAHLESQLHHRVRFPSLRILAPTGTHCKLMSLSTRLWENRKKGKKNRGWPQLPELFTLSRTLHHLVLSILLFNSRFLAALKLGQGILEVWWYFKIWCSSPICLLLLTMHSVQRLQLHSVVKKGCCVFTQYYPEPEDTTPF